MSDHAWPLLYAVLLWFVSTGVVLWLDGLPRRTRKLSFAAITALAAAALYGVWWSASAATVLGTYLAFTAALTVWGWHEMTFLRGLITGPRRAPCPPETRRWQRFKLASATLIYHELALALTAAAIVALTWGRPNQTGTLTFLVLLVMRISAKLNIFAGVPHLSDSFLPPQLDYLKSYFRKRPAGWLFGVSMIAASVLLAAFAQAALMAADSGDAAATAGFSLLAALVALAIVEHLFLVLPVADTALWRWATASRSDATRVRRGFAVPASAATPERLPIPALARVRTGSAE